MNHNKNQQDQIQKTAAPTKVAVAMSQNEIDFASSQDEVARKAYFTHLNQGSQDGHEVPHWLAAEAELIAERNQTRVHGFHNRT